MALALTLSELMLTTTGVRQVGHVSAKMAIGTAQPREEVVNFAIAKRGVTAFLLYVNRHRKKPRQQRCPGPPHSQRTDAATPKQRQKQLTSRGSVVTTWHHKLPEILCGLWRASDRLVKVRAQLEVRHRDVGPSAVPVRLSQYQPI